MKVLGKRILLDRPEVEESKIQLSPELQAEFDKKQMAKWKELKVFKVGTEVTHVEEGDSVYIAPMQLQSAELIEVDGSPKVMIREMDITLVW